MFTKAISPKAIKYVLAIRLVSIIILILSLITLIFKI
jgi:hypothetical protein